MFMNRNDLIKLGNSSVTRLPVILVFFPLCGIFFATLLCVTFLCEWDGFERKDGWQRDRRGYNRICIRYALLHGEIMNVNQLLIFFLSLRDER